MQQHQPSRHDDQQPSDPPEARRRDGVPPPPGLQQHIGARLLREPLARQDVCQTGLMG